MIVQEFDEEESEFSLKLLSEATDESARIVRLLLEGKPDSVEIYGVFLRGGDTCLRIKIPKAGNRQYRSIVELGAKKIY